MRKGADPNDGFAVDKATVARLWSCESAIIGPWAKNYVPGGKTSSFALDVFAVFVGQLDLKRAG